MDDARRPAGTAMDARTRCGGLNRADATALAKSWRRAARPVDGIGGLSRLGQSVLAFRRAMAYLTLSPGPRSAAAPNAPNTRPGGALLPATKRVPSMSKTSLVAAAKLSSLAAYRKRQPPVCVCVRSSGHRPILGSACPGGLPPHEDTLPAGPPENEEIDLIII